MRIHDNWQGNQSPHKAIEGITMAIKTSIKGFQRLEKSEIYINHFRTYAKVWIHMLIHIHTDRYTHTH